MDADCPSEIGLQIGYDKLSGLFGLLVLAYVMATACCALQLVGGAVKKPTEKCLVNNEEVYMSVLYENVRALSPKQKRLLIKVVHNLRAEDRR